MPGERVVLGPGLLAYSRETGKDWDNLSLVVSALAVWVTGTTQQLLRRYDGQPVRLLLAAVWANTNGRCPMTCTLPRHAPDKVPDSLGRILVYAVTMSFGAVRSP